MTNLWKRKRLLTGLLALLGAFIIVVYALCEDYCRYLKGSLWGLDLNYLGLIFVALVFILNILRKDNLCLALLSFGLGGEIFLIGYQVAHATYCPFCLAFGAVLICMFVINFNKRKIAHIGLGAAAGFIFFVSFFTGSVTPAFAGENFITSFGSGPVSVRLYTDYFCGPCRAAEPEIESILTTLIDKNAVHLTFIDTPIHKQTPLYARYFLYVLNEETSFARALSARRILYEAAAQRLATAAGLESFLAKKGLKFKLMDVQPVFKTLQTYINEDRINSTPSCVISGIKGKELIVGGQAIIKALKSLPEVGKDRTAAELK